MNDIVAYIKRAESFIVPKVIKLWSCMGDARINTHAPMIGLIIGKWGGAM